MAEPVATASVSQDAPVPAAAPAGKASPACAAAPTRRSLHVLQYLADLQYRGIAFTLQAPNKEDSGGGELWWSFRTPFGDPAKSYDTVLEAWNRGGGACRKQPDG